MQKLFLKIATVVILSLSVSGFSSTAALSTDPRNLLVMILDDQGHEIEPGLDTYLLWQSSLSKELVSQKVQWGSICYYDANGHGYKAELSLKCRFSGRVSLNFIKIEPYDYVWVPDKCCYWPSVIEGAYYYPDFPS